MRPNHAPMPGVGKVVGSIAAAHQKKVGGFQVIKPYAGPIDNN